jgi:hypothetical protein
LLSNQQPNQQQGRTVTKRSMEFLLELPIEGPFAEQILWSCGWNIAQAQQALRSRRSLETRPPARGKTEKCKRTGL